MKVAFFLVHHYCRLTSDLRVVKNNSTCTSCLFRLNVDTEFGFEPLGSVFSVPRQTNQEQSRCAKKSITSPSNPTHQKSDSFRRLHYDFPLSQYTFLVGLSAKRKALPQFSFAFSSLFCGTFQLRCGSFFILFEAEVDCIRIKGYLLEFQSRHSAICK